MSDSLPILTGRALKVTVVLGLVAQIKTLPKAAV